MCTARGAADWPKARSLAARRAPPRQRTGLVPQRGLPATGHGKAIGWRGTAESPRAASHPIQPRRVGLSPPSRSWLAIRLGRSLPGIALLEEQVQLPLHLSRVRLLQQRQLLVL